MTKENLIALVETAEYDIDFTSLYSVWDYIMIKRCNAKVEFVNHLI